MWTVVPDIYTVNTVAHILALIFKWKYLPCYWRYLDNSMSAILQSWCEISAHSPVYAVPTVVEDIYNVITVMYMQATIFKWTCLRCYWSYHDNSMRSMLQTWCQVQRTLFSLRCLNRGPGHIQCNYSYIYWGFNIQRIVCSLLLEISRQFNELYTANLVPNTVYNH
jgi:hypothetical protein